MTKIEVNDGRILEILPITPVEAMRLAEGCDQLSGVRQWWQMALTVSSVRTINDIPMPMPTHSRHIEGLVARFEEFDLQAIYKAIEEYDENDGEMSLVCKKLTPLETLRTWALIGEFELIPPWVGSAFTAISVREINGEKISFPNSKSEILDIVSRLGTGGMIQAAKFISDSNSSQAANILHSAKN